MQWKYVPTSDNPADLFSRGTSVKELIHQSRWFSGPKFLWKEESLWPTMPETLKEISEGDPEIMKEVQEPTSLPDTWFLPKQLSIEDINNTAEIQLIKYMQRSSFPQIMAILKRETLQGSRNPS